MTPSRWAEVRRVFEALWDVPRERLATRLGELCRDDSDLRREVERLLWADRRATGFLGRPGRDAPAPPDDALLGRHVGPYRLLEVLGRGGMSTVYLAERDDGEYRQRVALKRIHPRAMSREALARFRRERQLLAGLEHPHIARFLGGGTSEDGWPYLVMERVEGLPLDVYCDRHRLSVDDRLDLFLQLLDAVRYAHSNLLVHRDLKPENVLVRHDGVVKLLDFGIAKLLEPRLAVGLTRTGTVPMTPAYASPEQVRGAPITTGSDVYSLGVLLYELLSGRRPYGRGDVSERQLEDAILYAEPRPLSDAVRRNGKDGGTTATDLTRRLRGDLDVIVATALKKDPGERYASVEQLAEDLRRHRESRPIRARPATLRYRAFRFIQRHRIGVAAVLFLTFLLTGFVTALSFQAERVRNERERAEQVSQFLIELFSVSDPDVAPGGEATARELLTRGTRRLVDDLEDPLARADVLETLGRVHLRLGMSTEAEPLFRRSLALRRMELGADHPDTAAGLHHLGLGLVDRGELEAARDVFEKALVIRRRRLGERHPEVADTLEGLAQLHWRAERLGDAEALLRQAVEIRRGDPEVLHRARSLSDLGAVLMQRGRPYEGRRRLLESLNLRRQVLGPDHPELAQGWVELGYTYLHSGQPRRAEAVLVRALELQHRVLGSRHGALEDTLLSLADSLREQGRYEEAMERYREAVELDAFLHGSEDHQDRATLFNNLAVTLGLAGETAEARELFGRTLEIRRRLLGEAHPHVAQTQYSLAVLLAEVGDLREAEALLRQAEAALDGILPQDHPARAYSWVALAQVAAQQGRWSDAERRLAPALDLLRDSHPPGHWRVADAESLWAEILLERTRPAEALPLLERAYAVLLDQKSARDPRTRRTARRLRRADEALGRPAGPILSARW